MIRHPTYFELSADFQHYALVRAPALHGAAARIAWFQALSPPALPSQRELAWEELAPPVARDVLLRGAHALHGSQRRALCAWLVYPHALPAQADCGAQLLQDVLQEAGRELAQGRLILLRRDKPLLGGLHVPSASSQAPLVALGPERNKFSVRWVDELGQGLAGVPLLFEHGAASERTSSDPAGVACIRDSSATSASVRVADQAKLRALLKTRWATPRPDQPWVSDKDARVIAVGDEAVGSVSLAPERVQLVSLQPQVVRVRLLGAFFDTSKSFVLPSGLNGVRAVVSMYAQQANAKLLLVGHTDTAGKPDYNDKLSLERALSLKDYLSDNVDGWLAWYGDDVASDKRWGAAEDRAMIDALPDASSRAPTEHAVRWFQRTRGLSVDGKAGPQTRRALVSAYMALAGTSLPKNIEAIAHGCGENFPQKATGDGKAEPENRRVEVFFFAGSLGVLPAPPGDNSSPGAKEYPEWVKRARRTEDHSLPVGFKIRLVSSDGDAVPGVGFEVRFSDGSTQRGQLDAQGTASVAGPKGPYSIEYLDHADIRRKALAARAHRAIQSSDTALLLGVLSQPTDELAGAADAYKTFFDETGKGLAADARAALGESQDGAAGDHLLAASGLEPDNQTMVVAYAEPAQAPTASDGGEQGTAVA